MIIKETVVKGANGFGFTLKNSDAGFQTIINLDNLAQDSGLEIGDMLLSIDGLGLRGDTHDQIVERLRSFPLDARAELTLSRPKSHPLYRRFRGPSKDDIRGQVWSMMEDTNLADFPRPCHQRIPNFRGSRNACEKLLGLDCFRKANTVKVNPDKPQETARFLALQFNKKLLVPTPRLRHGLFNHVLPPYGFGAPDLKLCCNAEGVKHYGIPIPLKSNVEVDLIVVGSVAVSEKGYRIGKGEGFADLEWGMMATMGAVKCDTIVVTIVHDCQVMEIPDQLIEPHDITVDIILTPRRIIYCPGRLPRPSSLIWDKITPAKLREIPSLSRLIAIARERGLTVKLPRENSANNNNNNSNRNRRNRSEDAASRPYRDPHYAYQNSNYAQGRRSQSADSHGFNYGNNSVRGRQVQQRYRRLPNEPASQSSYESNNWSWNYGAQNQGRHFQYQNHTDGSQNSYLQNGQSFNAQGQPVNANGKPVRFYKREPARRGFRGRENGQNAFSGRGGGGGVRGGAQRRAPPRMEKMNRQKEGRRYDRKRLGSIKEEDEKNVESTEEGFVNAVARANAASGSEPDAAESGPGEESGQTESSPLNQRVRKDHRRDQKRSNFAAKSPRFRNPKQRRAAEACAIDSAVLEAVVSVVDSVADAEASLNASYCKENIQPLMETPIAVGLPGEKDEATTIVERLDALAISDSPPEVKQPVAIAAAFSVAAKEARSSSTCSRDSSMGDSLGESLATSDSSRVEAGADGSKPEGFSDSAVVLSNVSCDDDDDDDDDDENFQEAKGDFDVKRKEVVAANAVVANAVVESREDSDSDSSDSDEKCYKVLTPSVKSVNSVVEMVREQRPVNSDTESDDDYDDVSSAVAPSAKTGVSVEDIAVEVVESKVVATSGASSNAEIAKSAPTKSRIFGKVCSLLKSKQ